MEQAPHPRDEAPHQPPPLTKEEENQNRRRLLRREEKWLAMIGEWEAVVKVFPPIRLSPIAHLRIKSMKILESTTT